MGDTATRSLLLAQLRPVPVCVICQDPFDANHIPVALDCKHIFGKKCFVEWLEKGEGNYEGCPCCRRELFDVDNTIWSALIEEQGASLDAFLYFWMEHIAKFVEFDKRPYTIASSDLH